MFVYCVHIAWTCVNFESTLGAAMHLWVERGAGLSWKLQFSWLQVLTTAGPEFFFSISNTFMLGLVASDCELPSFEIRNSICTLHSFDSIPHAFTLPSHMGVERTFEVVDDNSKDNDNDNGVDDNNNSNRITTHPAASWRRKQNVYAATHKIESQ